MHAKQPRSGGFQAAGFGDLEIAALDGARDDSLSANRRNSQTFHEAHDLS